jgi:hypothetical protein
MISIIKQIQASIIGEAKWLRWVWWKCKRKAKYTIYMIKHQLPLKPRQITSSPSNQTMWMANTKFQTQEGSKKSTKISQCKRPYSPWTKAKHNKRQTQSKTWTPPEVENPMFYQMSLDKPQGKYRLLKQQSKSKCIWPRHKSHKSKNNHQWSQVKLTHHPQQEKCGPPQQLISKPGVRNSQLKVTSTLKMNTMTEQTWVVTKALWHKAVNKSNHTRSKYNLIGALHKRWTNQAAQEARYKIEQL